MSNNLHGSAAYRSSDFENRSFSPQKTPFSPPFPAQESQNLNVLCGYVCYTEKKSPLSVIVWSDKKFYRIPHSEFPSLKPLKPLTPIIFSTADVPDQDLGRDHHQTFRGFFKKIRLEGSLEPSPPRALGKFVKNGVDKITFEWNPASLLNSPLKVSLLARDFPNAKLDSDIFAKFSIGPPLLRNSDGIAFPFLKQVYPLQDGKEFLEDPKSEIPPTTFLEELAEQNLFQVHVAIGIPDNDVIPTLSLSDFVHLSDTKTLNWVNILRCLFDKYKTLAEDSENKTAARFVDQLTRNVSNPSGKKTILLFPGRWTSFIPPVAQILAQEILRNTRFGVFIAAQAHPLSDCRNVQELNPCLTGNSSLSFVEERIFFTSPIGFGEEESGQVCYDFIHNTKSFFLLHQEESFHPKT